MASEVSKNEGKIKCQYCGKWISSEKALEHEAGSLCLALREQGWDNTSLKVHRAELTKDEVPVTEDGREYVKLAMFKRLLPKHGIPVARIVNAIGKDRGLEPPAHEKFTPVYVGKARYVHPDCAEEWGLNFLRGMAGRSSSNGAAQGITEAIAEELAK